MSSNPQNLADDGLERIKALDVLTTLPELLTHHLTVRPDDVAYKVYDNASKSWKDLTFKNVYDQVHAWRHAFAARSELVRGDRSRTRSCRCRCTPSTRRSPPPSS